MAKNGDLPGRSTLLDVVKGVEIKYRNHFSTPESERLKREAHELRHSLLKNKRLRELERRAAKIESAERTKQNKLQQRKRTLINKVKLAPITPALIAEVRRFVGV